MFPNASPSSDTSQSHDSRSAAAPPRTLPWLALGAISSALVLALWLLFDPASPVYALITPPHNPDFTATGESPLQQFGFAVASAGDINDDGFGDVIVGANNVNNAIFVYTGSVNGLTTTVFFHDTGLGAENFGHSVAGGSDLNNDGIDDFVVGAPFSNTSTGAAYIYFGSGTGLPTRGVTLTGELPGDNFGWSVAMIGDVNHDGFSDLAVGASEQGVSDTGRVYIYHGPLVSGVAPVPNTLDGELPLDGFGVSVSGAGDVNGDGIDDLVVGAWKNEDGGTEAGKAYVFYGSPGGVNQSNFTAITGGENDKLGTSVHGAGDVNGDGFDDVIIGADTFDPGGTDLGRAEVYPGGPSGLITTTTLFAAGGEYDDDHFGFAVAGGGDLDGDGFADFAVGAYAFDAGGPLTDTGKAYAFAGCTPDDLMPTLIFTSTGDAASIFYGRALAIVNDVNGDQIDDLFVGDYGYPVGSTGKVYGYYGVAGGCRPALAVTKTVGLANYPALYTNTTAITVPLDAVVAYTYTVRNTGNITLTQHRVLDDKLGLVAQAEYTLIPNAQISAMITRAVGISATPGVSITNIATWTGSISITSPSGVTTPTNRALTASATSAARVNISGPTTDQDGDSIADNLEGSDDVDNDNLPNYLDTDSDADEAEDAVEVGPDPTHPADRDGDGIPGYLDPDEDPDTNTTVEIGGLSIAVVTKAARGENVRFTAVITAGTGVSYTWDFGDGTTGTEQNTTHAYAEPGTYVITVTATNSLGQKQATTSILIQYAMLLPRIMTIGVPNP